jgi:hypothetical protein
MEFWFVRVVPKYLNCSTVSNDLLPICMYPFCPHWHKSGTLFCFPKIQLDIIHPPTRTCLPILNQTLCTSHIAPMGVSCPSHLVLPAFITHATAHCNTVRWFRLYYTVLSLKCKSKTTSHAGKGRKIRNPARSVGTAQYSIVIQARRSGESKFQCYVKCCHLHVLASLTRRKEPLVPSGQKTGSPLQPVWTPYTRRYLFLPIPGTSSL